jgi:hypothetical protein
MKECPKCHRRYDDGSQYCTVDATPLTPNKKSGAGKVILILFAVLFGFCAFSGIIFSTMRSTRRASNSPANANSLASQPTSTPAESPYETALREVDIKKMDWHTGGFDSIMMADFTIENPTAYTIKDIEITCTHYAASGTRIDSNTRTIYEIIPPKKTRTFKRFNMGFIHSQAQSSSCKIVDLKVQ